MDCGECDGEGTVERAKHRAARFWPVVNLSELLRARQASALRSDRTGRETVNARRRYSLVKPMRFTHPGAEAVVGALLDDIKPFVRKWYGLRTPSSWGRGDGSDPEHRKVYEFFEHLGVLRERVRMWLTAINEIEPKAKTRIMSAGNSE